MIDKVGVFDGIKQAMQVIRHQWGGVVLGMGMVGLFFLVLTLIGIGVLVAAVKYSHNIELTLIVSIIAILYIVVIGIIRATVYMVFRTVLLHYAKTGDMPGGISQTVLRS